MADPIQILSLYSGSGMLDEAVAAGLDYYGFGSRVLGFIEREAFAAWFLLARMEAETMERAPVFCDGLENLDARPMCGFVDLLTASPPCQPYSSAGKRLGNADERSHGDGDGPLVHTVRIIAECRPALVFFENVPEWVTGGHFREFGEQLCNLGYDFAPPLFVAAADVGAPHERERVFILGWLGNADHSVRRSGRQWRQDQQPVAHENAGRELGDAERAEPRPGTESEQAAGVGRRGRTDTSGELAQRPSGGFGVGREPSWRDGFAEWRDEGVANGNGCGRWTQSNSDERAGGFDRGCGDMGQPDVHDRRRDDEPDQGRARIAGGRGEVPIFPPGRNDYRRWAALVAGGLDAALMPAVESGVQFLAYGTPAAHSDLLRISGNSVVPAQAGLAFAYLFGRFLYG